MLANSVDHQSPIRHRKRERFLAIHILARLQRHDGDDPMPVIGDDDDDRIDIIAANDFAEIVVGIALGRSAFGFLRSDFLDHRLGRQTTVEVIRFSVAGAAFVDIANGQHVAQVGGQETLQQRHPLIARANESDADTVAGRIGTPRRTADDQWRGNSRGVLQELTTTHEIKPQGKRNKRERIEFGPMLRP